jgi:periplasmic protein TonB
MTDAPEPPSAPPPEPPPQSAPEAAPPPASAPQRPPWLPIAIGAAAAVILGLGFLVYRSMSGGAAEDAYTVEAYTPQTELITASERVPGYEAPDTASPQAVTFGAGVTLNVTGRVSRGLGNDWYAVAWNDRTVFVRQADAVTGAGAPPPVAVREEEPDEEVKEEEKPDPLEEPDEEEVAEAPAPTWGLEISDVSWVREPNSRDFARYFPRRALDQGQSGRVTLDCVIAGNGRLDCSVAQESPSGYGFGEAALDISRNARVRPTLPDGSSAAGRHLRLPLSFRAG